MRDTHVWQLFMGWEPGLQRKGLLSSDGIACCGVMSERQSCLTTPLGIGSLDFREKVR